MMARPAAMLAIQAILRGDQDRARMWIRHLTQHEQDRLVDACEKLAEVAREVRR